MALDRQDTGRYAYRPVAERLGPDAPATWTFMTNLATCDLARRRFSEAEAAINKCLRTSRKTMGLIWRWLPR
ncbi:MAG: hypothetical protein IT166_03275 [Bryobacterales bacterium]|nr:hypothetical protein [Bryobacterales bacterium]